LPFTCLPIKHRILDNVEEEKLLGIYATLNKEVERQSTYHILGGTGHPSRFSPPISRKKSTR
jgi:hypothetical protein